MDLNCNHIAKANHTIIVLHKFPTKKAYFRVAHQSLACSIAAKVGNGRVLYFDPPLVAPVVLHVVIGLSPLDLTRWCMSSLQISILQVWRWRRPQTIQPDAF